MPKSLILNEKTYLHFLKESNSMNKLPPDLVSAIGRPVIQKSHNNFAQHVAETDDVKLTKLLPHVVCVYKNDYDYFYVYMPRNKKVYYMDADEIKFDERGSWPYKEFIKRYKSNTLMK
jgi:5'-3' exonuclease